MRTVLVLFDSLNRLALGAYGGPVPTPNLDRFAARAVTFDRHYTGSLPCMPARRDLHTGRLNLMHRSWGPLEPFDASLPRILSAAGVYTHLITDHQHYFEDGGAGYVQAYDSWEFFRGQENDNWIGQAQPDVAAAAASRDPRHYPIGHLAGTVTRGNCTDQEWKRLRGAMNAGVQEIAMSTPRCLSRACDFLRDNAAAPDWFLQVECFDPHEPFTLPANRRGDGPLMDWPPYRPDDYTAGERVAIRRSYNALVQMCDDHFGRLLDTFDALHLWHDTCLIVTTDHGFLLGEHDWWGKNRTAPYEELAHIPLILWHPDQARLAGQRRQALTQTPDLMPTVLAIHGITPPPHVTAHSLLPVLHHDTPQRPALITGLFGSPLAVIAGDGACLLRDPLNATGEGLHEYTLMPCHMARPFEAQEFAGATLHPGFAFTEGMPVLRLPCHPAGKRPPGTGAMAMVMQGDRLFDLRTDPGQVAALEDTLRVERLAQVIATEFLRHDAPPEMYHHYRLEPEGGRP